MKKHFFLFFVIVSFISAVLIPHQAHAESTTYIKILRDNTAIMDNRTQPLVQVGSLNKGEVFPATRYGANWWKISFGNNYGYIYAPNASVTTAPKTSSSNVMATASTTKAKTSAQTSNTMVITNSTMDVYDNSTGKLVSFAKIQKNVRYPVINSYGANWWTVDVGGRIGYIYKPATSIDKGVPVLMYHHFLKTEENKNFVGVSTTITPEAFDQQMNYLKKAGYQTISPADLEKFIAGEINLPGKAVVLTFDDGLKSNYIYAYPILKKYGFQATNFFITSRLNSRNVAFDPDVNQTLSTDEMKQMQDVFTFQGHTHNLHYFINGKGAILSTPYADVVNDLKTNRSKVSPYSNGDYLAFPFGHYNTAAIQAAKEAGYKMAFTTKKGLVNVGDAPYEINRINVGPEVTLTTFQRLVQQGY